MQTNETARATLTDAEQIKLINLYLTHALLASGDEKNYKDAYIQHVSYLLRLLKDVSE